MIQMKISHTRGRMTDWTRGCITGTLCITGTGQVLHCPVSKSRVSDSMQLL